MERLISLLGLGVFIAIAYALSNNRPAIRWKPILWGIALQLIFALLILRTPFGLALFKSLGNGITRFLDFSDVGAEFVFGENFRDFFVAFKILPTIIFFSAIMLIIFSTIMINIFVVFFIFANCHRKQFTQLAQMIRI